MAKEAESALADLLKAAKILTHSSMEKDLNDKIEKILEEREHAAQQALNLQKGKYQSILAENTAVNIVRNQQSMAELGVGPSEIGYGEGLRAKHVDSDKIGVYTAAEKKDLSKAAKSEAIMEEALIAAREDLLKATKDSICAGVARERFNN